MTQTTATQPRQEVVPLRTGGEVAAIIPHSVEEMFRLASAIASSGLAPRTLDTKEKVLVAIMAGAELGLAPHQAVQSFYVVNQRPTLWGDAIPALLWANGFKLKEWYEGDGDELTAKCEVTRPTGEVIPGEFSTEDARKAKLLGKDGPWQTNPKRMLKMRARAFAARDGASDVLKGFQVREEVEDFQEIREIRGAQPTGMRGRLESRRTVGGFDRDHVEAELEAAEVEVETVLPPMKTGRQIQAEQEAEQQAAGAAQTGQGPDTPAEPENAAQEAGAGGAGQSDDDFPGDRAATTSQVDQGGGSEGASPGPNKPPAGGQADPVQWAVDFLAEVESMSAAEIDAAMSDPVNVEMYTRLDDLKPTIAKDLNAKVEARKRAAARG